MEYFIANIIQAIDDNIFYYYDDCCLPYIDEMTISYHWSNHPIFVGEELVDVYYYKAYHVDVVDSDVMPYHISGGIG